MPGADDSTSPLNRLRVLHIIKSSPGIHAREIARRLAMGHKTARYHLKRLVDSREICAVSLPGRTIYCANTDRAFLANPALMDPGAMDLLQYLQTQPASLAQLAKRLQWSSKTIRRRLIALEQERIVHRTPTYHPIFVASERAARLLENLRPHIDPNLDNLCPTLDESQANPDPGSNEPRNKHE